MASLPEPSRIARFGIFEVDLQARELRKAGLKIRLHDQPFQVLAALIERPGEVVTREELRKKIWPGGTFVDFDSGLNTAVNKLREALGDSAENPRFVETLSRRGYRFLVPVEGKVNKEALAIEERSPGAVECSEQPGVAHKSKWHWQLLPWALVVILSLIAVFLAAAYLRGCATWR
jgi:cholera toxin transcriptional activator